VGSSHGTEINPMVQENFGTKFDICSIFKQNNPLENVFEGIRKICKGLTKQNHIIIAGGPGKSLERKYQYSIKNDLNFIAERT
jgi:hypothetical protein